MPVTTRRGVAAFLALAGAAHAVPAASVIPMPALDLDAELHATVAAFRAADDALSLDNLSDDDTPEGLWDRWDDGVETLTNLSPNTLPGLAAKAQAALLAMDRSGTHEIGATVPDACEPHWVLAYSLAHDVLAVAGDTPWPPHPAKAEHVAQYEAMQAERAESPPPSPEWRVRADAERARLAAIGLHREGGFTTSDRQLVAWLCRRVAAEMGAEAAERVFALTTLPRAEFGAGFSYDLDRLS